MGLSKVLSIVLTLVLASSSFASNGPNLNSLFKSAHGNHISLMNNFKKEDKADFLRNAPHIVSDLNVIIDRCYEDKSCKSRPKEENLIYKSKLLLKVINSKFALYYYERANVYFEVRNFNKAIRIFQKALSYKHGITNIKVIKKLKSCTSDYECMLELAEIQKPLLKKVDVLTFDTRSEGVCDKLEEMLKSIEESSIKDHLIEEACGYGSELGIKQLFIQDKREFSKEHLSWSINSSKDPRIHQVARDNSYTVFLGGIIMTALYLAPESISNWNDVDKKGDLQFKFGRASKYVTSRPVWDDDPDYMNFVLHPLAGGFYYLRARKAGFGVLSVINGIFMSTVFWEYGIEGFMEPPSIQDLIVTPFVGAIVGEVAFQIIKYIDKHEGNLLGSKTLGKIVKVMADPGEYVLRGLKKILKPISSKFDDAGFRLFYNKNDGESPRDDINELGLIFELKF